ncbi:AMP-binding protein [Parachitinimonas caeni]|uniref:AMP-binding protein n=1 Tax=Parachitinimonas caeni TaxID=3031301 RepID=A0ABT7DUX3_9NEIS|nr:AMP-binding protein [Parachitinimonas caeni]MDK2123871.1 AMP-binding protein [Parachitinimonas caeni]
MSLPELRLFESLQFRCRVSPHAIALVDGDDGRQLSYAELLEFSGRVSAGLAASGIRAGDRVALLAGNQLETFVLLYACARLDAMLAPLNWRLTEAELQPLMGNCEPGLLLFDPQFADLAVRLATHQGAPCRPYAAAMAEWRQTPSHWPPSGTAGSEVPVLILYTSGTTGLPKGVLLSQAMLGWNALNTCRSWDIGANDVGLVHTPLFHTGGLNVSATPLLACGGRVVVVRQFEPSAILRCVAAQGVTVLFAVPQMFKSLLEHPDFALADLHSLRFCISGGAPCPVSLIRAYQQRGLVFKQGFGMTEVGPNCLTLHEHDSEMKAGWIGYPNSFTQARVVDRQGQTVPAGRVGELHLAGPMVCSGYWRNPLATAELFDGKWLKTGDLVLSDAEGCLKVVDRKKDMFISGGENVYPAEIEAVLLESPLVSAAAVIGVPDERWGEVGCACVVVRPGYSETALRSFVSERLARYKQPCHYRELESLPLTPTGKVKKSLLRELLSDAKFVDKFS